MTVSRAAFEGDRNVSTVVVEAVADALGVSPIELDPPLHRAVNPDALDALFRSNWSSDRVTQVSFTYAGCEVTVRGQGEIVVESGSEPDAEPVA